MHQAEIFVKQIVEQIGQSSYMKEFLKKGKNKRAIEDVAKKLNQFSENMSVLQPIAIKGFMVPSGSLMLFRYLQEELDAMEAMLQDDFAEKETGRKAGAGKESKTAVAQHKEANAMTAEQKEEVRTRIGIVKHRLSEMTESLLSQHIADQIEQRTDEKAAQEAFEQNGYLPLYLDERTMGIVYNTLTMQLLLDRFNLIFESVFEPMDQTAIKSIMSNVLVPYWKQNAQSILFTMEEGNNLVNNIKNDCKEKSTQHPK